MTPEGQARAKARGPRVTEPSRFEHFTLYDRCITRGLIGSILPVIYGNSLDITQGPGVVAIRNEMIHETRVVPLDNVARPVAAIRNYMGTSRGRWDGNILVVETTNFTDQTAIGINGSGNAHSDALRVTERFIPVDRKTVRWEVTVDDPKTWAASMDVRSAADEGRLAGRGRIRLSRGQLRHPQHADRRRRQAELGSRKQDSGIIPTALFF